MRGCPRRSRTALAMVTGLLAGVALSGCAAEPAAELTVLGSWTGEEEVEFIRVLDKFEAASGIRTRYQGHRDVSQVLQVGIERGRPPDVAILPRLNDLQRYVNAGHLAPLTGAFTTDPAAAPQLIKLTRKIGSDGNPVGGELAYAVTIATHLKSVVWYDPAELAKFGQTPPRTWEEMVNQTQRLAAGQQVPWCLGMSAPPVSGWPGTDWIEDILLHDAGQVAYEQWTRGDLPWTAPAMKDAWETWGSLLRVSAGETARASLYTKFQVAGTGLFPGTEASAKRGCHLDHQGSFVIRDYREYLDELPSPTDSASPAPSFTFFPTPPPAGKTDNSSLQEVSDDVAAMFRDTEPARKLMSYLASEQAQTARRAETEDVAFSRRTPTAEYPDPVTKAVAARLHTGTMCWDGADLLPAAMATAFERAVLVYLEAPERLDVLLTELEAVRGKLSKAEWMDLQCVPTA
ncbi:ABC transporter substrate-binding protein [Micromonospora arborensis]|uniref:ABC transporter substrate-binding protein n=2 Tax=Micromonospora arborensis TaxID=2116518 RepID=A0A318NG72_9ACTN|nr:ABC transporter substrate-binding protein [Micromonospora arborensis]